MGRPRRRVPSSTCVKLARDLMLTLSGRRQPPTRRRMRKRMTKKRRRPSSTSRDRLARRSSTSTSPSPTRAAVVVVGIVDVVAVGVVMEKDVPHTGSAVRARMVSAEHRGNQGSQGPRERKASSSQGEVEAKEAEVVDVEKVVAAARVADVAKDAEPVEVVESHVENSASTRRPSPPWGNEETREERSYDLLILYREHSSEEHKIKKILPQKFYVFL